jgi:hypothetical protein
MVGVWIHKKTSSLDGSFIVVTDTTLGNHLNAGGTLRPKDGESHR